jgi:hypothetical protein
MPCLYSSSDILRYSVMAWGSSEVGKRETKTNAGTTGRKISHGREASSYGLVRNSVA